MTPASLAKAGPGFGVKGVFFAREVLREAFLRVRESFLEDMRDFFLEELL
jgi:hypothetical protein